MPKRVRASSLEWTPNPDGEYNEVVTDYKGHRIEVFSDRNEQKWFYRLDDHSLNGPCDTSESAQQEAIDDINESWPEVNQS